MEELIIRERETREKLVQLINNSQLPAILIKPMLEEMLNQIITLSEEQYKLAVKNKEGKDE